MSVPYQIVKHLNEYVIGQERAKRILAVAVYNHYNRVSANMERMAPKRRRQREMLEDDRYPATTLEFNETLKHHPDSRAIVSADLTPVDRESPYGT